MTLTPGAKLGPYEILSPLGAGGMGEVYRAKDSRLGREVAIKVLPESTAKDPEALARFEREAKAVAALSHPNILALFDVGHENGVVYAVMELLEGETLRARLNGGAVPARKAQEYARQITRGLAAAHEKGFVHRDLKPENLFLTRDGQAKILDFGLAKQADPLPGAATGQDTPTRWVATEPGVLIGSAGYMSPEQIRGLPADAQSDLFSFGAVLYEMLAGRPAFRRETAADTLIAILKDEPPEFPAGATGQLLALERIVRRCIEKEPVARFHSASDLAFNLEALSDGSGDSGRTSEMPAGVARHSRRRWLPWAAGLAAGLALAAGIAFFRRPPPAAPPVFRRLTFRQGTIFTARYGPDGHSVVYAAAMDGGPVRLFARAGAVGEARLLDLPAANLLAVSREGELAVALSPRKHYWWWSQDAVLARARLDGGAPREIAANALGAEWLPDGKLALARYQDDTGGSVEWPGGTGRLRSELDNWSELRLAPGGGAMALLEHGSAGKAGKVILLPAAGEKRVLTPEWNIIRGLAWRPDGKEIWYSAAGEAAPQEIRAVNPATGRDRLVLRGASNLIVHDIARDGRTLVSAIINQREAWWVGRSDNRPKRVTELDWTMPVDLGPGGWPLLLQETGEAGGPEGTIYLRAGPDAAALRLDTGRPQRISPDGRRVLAIRHREGRMEMAIIPVGAGDTKVLERGAVVQYDSGGWAGNDAVWFDGSEAGKPSRGYLQKLDGPPVPLTAAGESIGDISDGGRWVLILHGGAAWMQSLPGGERLPVRGYDAALDFDRLSADGRYLLLTRIKAAGFEIIRLDWRSGKSEVLLTHEPPAEIGSFSISGCAISPDGGAAAYSHVKSLGTLYEIEGLK